VNGLAWTYDDGGREAAGFRGDAGDCVTRSIAIVARLPYQEVYAALAGRMGAAGAARSARNGIPRKVYEAFLLDELGFVWRPTMKIGSGCTVHLRHGELPERDLVVRLSRHLTAVVGGVVRDSHDPTRDGTRCVYG
jgi:hypothetical protein